MPPTMNAASPGSRLARGAVAFLVAFHAGLSACSGESTGPQPVVEPPDQPEPPSRPVPCIFANATCAERIEIENGLFLPSFTTHQLSAEAPGVTRGLIVLHGNTRNADTYFESGIQAIADGGLAGTAVVVAPRFQTSDDDPQSDEPFWSSAGWKEGNLSNPSTYLYLRPERETADGSFAISGGNCEDHDDWHYGLRDRNSYADALDADTIRAQLSRRDVRMHTRKWSCPAWVIPTARCGSPKWGRTRSSGVDAMSPPRRTAPKPGAASGNDRPHVG